MPIYTVKDLEEIAAYFETLANDQEACIGWFVKTKLGIAKCNTEAAVWRDAASIIRNTTIIVGDKVSDVAGG